MHTHVDIQCRYKHTQYKNIYANTVLEITVCYWAMLLVMCIEFSQYCSLFVFTLCRNSSLKDCLAISRSTVLLFYVIQYQDII